MCRNIKKLYNLSPPANEEEIREAALQFVRKLSGFTRPSQANAAAFDAAVDAITAASSTLMAQLTTQAPPRDRETERALARARNAKRFGK